MQCKIDRLSPTFVLCSSRWKRVVNFEWVNGEWIIIIFIIIIISIYYLRSLQVGEFDFNLWLVLILVKLVYLRPLVVVEKSLKFKIRNSIVIWRLDWIPNTHTHSHTIKSPHILTIWKLHYFIDVFVDVFVVRVWGVEEAATAAAASCSITYGLVQFGAYFLFVVLAHERDAFAEGLVKVEILTRQKLYGWIL